MSISGAVSRLSRRLPLAVALVAMSSPAYAEWWEAKTAHFTVVSDSSEADTSKFAQKLERFIGALRLMQNMKPLASDIGDANRVTVYRFGDNSDIARTTGAPGSGIAGFYIPRAGGSVAFVPIHEERRTGSIRRVGIDEKGKLPAYNVLLHEYTHHFMLQTFPAAYPGWYVEGYAELYSTLDLRDDGSFHIGNPPNWRASALFNLNLMQAEKLFDTERRVTGFDQYQYYSVGWLVAHYLSFSKKREGQLAAYLMAIGKGESGLPAARRIFGDLSELDGELRRYKNGPFPGFDVRPQNYAPPAVAIRKLTAAEADVMKVRVLLHRGVTRKQAEGLARNAIPLAARYPNDLGAQLVLTEANLDADKLDLADSAADRALAIDPKSVEAMIFKGRIANERGRTQPMASAAGRPFLVKAAGFDPTDPRPMIEYYRSYRGTGKPIPENAIITLEDAFSLAAHDDSYRMLLALHLLEEGKLDAVKNVLTPLAVSAHGSKPEKNIPQIVIDLIAAGKRDEALARLTKAVNLKNDEDGDGEEDD